MIKKHQLSKSLRIYEFLKKERRKKPNSKKVTSKRDNLQTNKLDLASTQCVIIPATHFYPLLKSNTQN